MHIRRRCTAKACRRTVPPGARACPGCGGREFSYIARYTDPDGRERGEHFTTRGDAEAFAVGQEAAKIAGSWIDPAKSKTKLREYHAVWRARTDERMAATTADKWDRSWRLDVGPALGGSRLADISRGDIEDMVAAAERRSSAWQAAEALKLVRTVLNDALDHGFVLRNPASRISEPKGGRAHPRA